jgi:hypothetical protein
MAGHRRPRLAIHDAREHAAAANPIWGGAVFVGSSAPTTSITATFTVPPLKGRPGSYASVWVGIGDVMQTGIYLIYDSTQPGNAACSPWTWFISGNGAGEIWAGNVFNAGTAYFPVSAGDSLTLTLSLDSSYWYATQVNHTRGWRYEQKQSVQAVNIASSVWNFPYRDCEVIIENENTGTEKPVYNLPDYGTVTFTDIAAVPAIDPSSILYLSSAQTKVDQSPGIYADGTLTMKWENYS